MVVCQTAAILLPRRQRVNVFNGHVNDFSTGDPLMIYQ